MAEVYSHVKGKKLEKFIAMHEETQDGLEEKANRRGRRAAIILRMHRADGHSFIEMDKGRIDHYIVLNDMRGQKAAMAIEFGRDDNEEGRKDSLGRLVAPSEPVAALRRSVGLI